MTVLNERIYDLDPKLQSPSGHKMKIQVLWNPPTLKTIGMLQLFSPTYLSFHISHTLSTCQVAVAWKTSAGSLGCQIAQFGEGGFQRLGERHEAVSVIRLWHA